MIKIEIFRNENKDICGFNAIGHADYSKFGTDIVCASVSILIFNTLNCIENYANEPFEYFVNEGGLLRCLFTEISKGGKNHDASLLLNSMYLGLESIKEEYGMYIEIKNSEV